MFKLIHRLFRRSRDAAVHPTTVLSTQAGNLESDYRRMIENLLHRWGVARACYSIEVRKIGRNDDGLDVLVGMVRLSQWDRDSALRLLLGLPMLESRVRKEARASWFGDLCHFGGLWVQASEQLQALGHTGELVQLVGQLAPRRQASEA